SVERDGARAEYEDQQRSEPERVRIGSIELSRFGKDRLQRFAVGGEVGNSHVHEEWNGNQPGSEPNKEQDAAETFQQRNEPGIEYRKRNAQIGKKADRLGDVLQLAPSGLPELPSPIETHEQQQRGLQRVEDLEQTKIETARSGDDAHKW